MLGTLIKHEFKALNRYFIPLNIGLIAISLIGKIFLLFSIESAVHMTISALLLVTYILLLFVGVIATAWLCISRFYRNLYTDEGYLMFTLPVKPWEHIVAKGIVNFVWTLINFIVIILSVFILVIRNGAMLSDIAYAFTRGAAEYRNIFGHSLSSLMLLLLLGYIVSNIFSIMTVYASITVGQLFSKHKILGAFGCYFFMSFILQIIYSIFSIYHSTRITSNLNFIDYNTAEAIYQNLIIGTLVPTMIISLILSVILFFITNYIMNKKLNLG